MNHIGVGSGCPVTVFTVPEHNPKPSTARGKRRYAALDADRRTRRERMWGAPRSNTPSKKQLSLMESRSAVSRRQQQQDSQ
jgi:hypothetical protein